ncbi:hypothetical protein GCM10022284_44040 [Streptomyces hundungensis]
MPSAFDATITECHHRAFFAESDELDLDAFPRVTEATDALSRQNQNLILDLWSVTFEEQTSALWAPRRPSHAPTDATLFASWKALCARRGQIIRSARCP